MSLMEVEKPKQKWKNPWLAKEVWITPLPVPEHKAPDPVTKAEELAEGLSVPPEFFTTPEIKSPGFTFTAFVDEHAAKTEMPWEQFKTMFTPPGGPSGLVPETGTGGRTLAQEFLYQMRQVVAEVGQDYRYPMRPNTMSGTSALYVFDGKPDCLVGRVLHRMGVSTEDLHQMEGWRASHVIDRIYPSRTEGLAELKTVAYAAQYVNDMQMDWGLAESHILMHLDAAQHTKAMV